MKQQDKEAIKVINFITYREVSATWQGASALIGAHTLGTIKNLAIGTPTSLDAVVGWTVADSMAVYTSCRARRTADVVHKSWWTIHSCKNIAQKVKTVLECLCTPL